MAAANTPLGELWVLGAPVFLAWEGLLWILGAVTVIEGIVISLVLRIPLHKGLGIALIANVVSSLAGAAFYLLKCFAIILLVLLVAVLDMSRDRLRIPMAPLTIPGIFLAMFITSVFWTDSASRTFGSFDVQTRLLALIPAFLMSFLAEFLVHFCIDRKTHPGTLCIAWGAANCISYPFLALIFLLSPMPDFMSPGANSWGATKDIRLAIERGDLDRAIEHSDTLRAILRQEPWLLDYKLEVARDLARTLNQAGRHRQALMVLAEFPLPEDSRLQMDTNRLRDEILATLRASHHSPHAPASPSQSPPPEF